MKPQQILTDWFNFEIKNIDDPDFTVTEVMGVEVFEFTPDELVNLIQYVQGCLLNG